MVGRDSNVISNVFENQHEIKYIVHFLGEYKGVFNQHKDAENYVYDLYHKEMSRSDETILSFNSHCIAPIYVYSNTYIKQNKDIYKVQYRIFYFEINTANQEVKIDINLNYLTYILKEGVDLLFFKDLIRTPHKIFFNVYIPKNSVLSPFLIIEWLKAKSCIKESEKELILNLTNKIQSWQT